MLNARSLVTKWTSDSGLTQVWQLQVFFFSIHISHTHTFFNFEFVAQDMLLWLFCHQTKFMEACFCQEKKIKSCNSDIISHNSHFFSLKIVFISCTCDLTACSSDFTYVLQSCNFTFISRNYEEKESELWDKKPQLPLLLFILWQQKKNYYEM